MLKWTIEGVFMNYMDFKNKQFNNKEFKEYFEQMEFMTNISKAIDIVTNNVYTYANNEWTLVNEQKFIVSKDNSTITSNALVSDTLYTNNISSNSMKPIVNYELTKITKYGEEIAFDKGWINSEQLSNLAQKYMKTDYGKYLKDVADNVFGEE